MKSNIVVISGKQGSGKSTVAELLIKHSVSTIECFKFADPLYELHDVIYSQLLQHIYVNVPRKDGELLQWLGTNWGRKRFGENVWADILKHRVHSYLRIYPKNIVVIDDCRFPNELAAFPEALKIRLECSQKLRKARCTSWRNNSRHVSEIALDGYAVDSVGFHRVYNTGVMSAKDVAQDVLRMLEVQQVD